jgi:hypothetical protein
MREAEMASLKLYETDHSHYPNMNHELVESRLVTRYGCEVAVAFLTLPFELTLLRSK